MFKLFFLFLSTLLFSQDITPSYKLKSIGVINDFVVVNEKIYVAGDEGVVEIFDLKSKKVLEFIALDPFISPTGEITPSRILSIDVDKEKILLVSISKNAYRNVWLYENHTLTKIIDESKKLTIKEARFKSDGEIVLATFDSDVLVYEKSENYTRFKYQVSQSALCDIVLSEDKKNGVICDESGAVKIIDLNSSKTKELPNTQNLDNVYHVAYANGVILTAGQDRRVAIYRDGEKATHIKSNFLVYCVGISPSGKYGVYSSNEDQDLQVFNTQTKKKNSEKLIGHKALVNQIKFISETEFISSERGPHLYFWKI